MFIRAKTGFDTVFVSQCLVNALIGNLISMSGKATYQESPEFLTTAGWNLGVFPKLIAGGSSNV